MPSREIEPSVAKCNHSDSKSALHRVSHIARMCPLLGSPWLLGAVGKALLSRFRDGAPRIGGPAAACNNGIWDGTKVVSLAGQGSGRVHFSLTLPPGPPSGPGDTAKASSARTAFLGNRCEEAIHPDAGQAAPSQPLEIKVVWQEGHFPLGLPLGQLN